MNIQKNTNKIEVLENGVIQVRLQKQLIDNGEVIETLGYERYVLTPDTDINTITCDKVKAIAQATWTDEIKQSYLDSLESESI